MCHNFEKIKSEVNPAVRGNREYFSGCPWHGGSFFSTDMPTSKSGTWLLDKEKEKALAEIEDKMDGADFGILPDKGGEIKRITIKESVWTETDVVKAQQSLGEVKRKGYSYFK
jgi:hypothetical protein